MKAGDLIEWEWYLGTDWEVTRFTGVIVKEFTHPDGFILLEVLSNDGLVNLRPDETQARVISPHANEDSPVV